MALQDTVGGAWLARFNQNFETTTGFTLNASTTKVVTLIRAPKAGVIDTVEFLIAALTTAQDVKVSLQGVGLTTGNPDGVVGQYRVIPSASLAANTWTVPGLMTSNGTDGGTKRTVTLGEWLAVVWEWNATQGSLFIANVLSGPNDCWSGHEYAETFAGSWTASHQTPNIVLKYNDGTYACALSGGYAVASQTSVSLTTATTPDEYALRFQVPFDAAIGGCMALVKNSAGGLTGPSYDAVLYDSSDIVRVVAPAPPFEAIGTGAVPVFILFPEVALVSKNTTYRLAIRPTTTSGITVYAFNVQSQSILAACPGGGEWYASTRSDVGAWTDIVTRRPWISLGLAGLSDGL